MKRNYASLIILLIGISSALALPAGAVGGDMGWYTIHCNVNGASVYFDGNYKGDIAGGVLSVAVYSTAAPYSEVSVQKQGYPTATTTLPTAPSPGETVNVYVTLNPGPTATATESGTGGFYITTSPSGARIHVNNIYQGLSPLTLSNLKAGLTYTIEAELDGYESSSTNVYLHSGYTQNVHLNLGSPGSISVTSDPSDAYVYVNSKMVGKTPYVITGLSSGNHEIEVTKNGYYNYKKTVNVIEGTQISVYADLNPIAPTNEILVTSEPYGAKIYLDGVYVGETMDGVSYPVQNVANGQHQLKLTLPGYSDYTTSVTMTGSTVNIFADMEEGPVQNTGYLSISSTPSGAYIYLDNVYKGTITPFTLTGVPAGEHTVMLSLSGYEDTYSKVTVNAGQTSTLTIGMAKTNTQTTIPTPQPTQSAPGLAVLTAVLGIFAGILILKRK